MNTEKIFSLSLFFFFFLKVIILQCCVGFCCTKILKRTWKLKKKKKKNRAEGYNNWNEKHIRKISIILHDTDWINDLEDRILKVNQSE